MTPPTEAEMAHARKLFDEAQERIDRLTEADSRKEVSPKFWDDTSGTEYEGWRDRLDPRRQPQPNPSRPDSVKP